MEKYKVKEINSPILKVKEIDCEIENGNEISSMVKAAFSMVKNVVTIKKDLRHVIL